MKLLGCTLLDEQVLKLRLTFHKADEYLMLEFDDWPKCFILKKLNRGNIRCSGRLNYWT